MCTNEKMNRGKMLVMATAMAATLATAANADVFTDSAAFNAANPGLTLIDFEGFVGPGDFTGNANEFFSGQGVSFSLPDDPGFWTVIDGPNGDFEFPTSVLTPNTFSAPIQISFTGEVASVGFNVAVVDFINFPATSANVTIEVFNNNALLASESFETGLFTEFTDFRGFSNLGNNITSILITPVGDFPVLAIDNLSFGSVPAPGSLAILGLGGLVGGRRRR